MLIKENGGWPGVRMAKSDDRLSNITSLVSSRRGATRFPAIFHFTYTAQVVYLASASNGIAMLYNSPCYPPFTLEQATSLATWSLIRPCGLAVRIARDHERFSEVAMLFRHDPEDVRYLMNPTSSGTVILVRLLGGKWALPTVEAALAKVLALEKRAATVNKTVAEANAVGAVARARP